MIIEKIAKYVHEEMWCKWAQKLMDEEDLSMERCFRWYKCMIPYEEQTEEMKDLDRMFAKGIVKAIFYNKDKEDFECRLAELVQSKYKSYQYDRLAIDRLKAEYDKHKNLIIGFDFDCTVYDLHKEGLYVQPVIELLKKCSDLGFTLCVFSNCPTDENVKFKQDYLISLGLNVTYFNESPLCKTQSELVPRKPHFSILLDDRAGLSSSYSTLQRTLKELQL